MKILIVSTTGPVCGIANHTRQLMAAVEATGYILPSDHFSVSEALLDPAAAMPYGFPDLLHLNYHAALHSRWTVDAIEAAKRAGMKVLVTYHDSGTPNSAHCQQICGAADHFVIHEPYDDLPDHGTYLRMGVPAFSGRDWMQTPAQARRPFVGTCGHDFPWKCWNAMAEAATHTGWGLRICTPSMTEERRAELQRLNPWLDVEIDLRDDELIDALHGCDATAFLNVCHNTGQSAAILQGIAARKPVIALETCRQYRALRADALGDRAIEWVTDFDDFVDALRCTVPARFDAGIVALAEQDSWTVVGKRYVEIYRSLL